MLKGNRFLRHWHGLFGGSREKDMKVMKRLPRVRKMARKIQAPFSKYDIILVKAKVVIVSI